MPLPLCRTKLLTHAPLLSPPPCAPRAYVGRIVDIGINISQDGPEPSSSSTVPYPQQPLASLGLEPPSASTSPASAPATDPAAAESVASTSRTPLPRLPLAIDLLAWTPLSHGLHVQCEAGVQLHARQASSLKEVSRGGWGREGQGKVPGGE